MSAPRGGLALLPVGQGLLDDVRGFLLDNDVPVPDRYYLAPGAPGLIAWDCEQLVVSLASVSWGPSEDAGQLIPQVGGAAGVLEVRHAQWSVQLVRCTPQMDDNGDPPGMEEIQAAGEQALTDAGMLSQCLVNCAAFPKDHEWMPAGATARAGGVISLGPSGGYHGFEASFSMTTTELS